VKFATKETNYCFSFHFPSFWFMNFMNCSGWCSHNHLMCPKGQFTSVMTYQRFASVLGRCLKSVRFLLDTGGYQVPQVVGPKGPPFFLHACDRSLHTVGPSDGVVTRIGLCPLATTSARHLMFVTPLSTGLTYHVTNPCKCLRIEHTYQST
jgi:hypothetical protein